MGLHSEEGDCVFQLAKSSKVFPLMHHEVVADGSVVYSGYSDRKASKVFLQSGRNGSKYIIRFLNGVGVTFSRAI